MRVLRLPLLTILFAAALTGQAVAQATQTEIAARLVGKPLYLRGFWAEDKLAFDAAGKLLGNSRQVPFTESGIDVKWVTVKDDRLQIDGERMGVAFSRSGEVSRVSGKSKHESGKIHIEITAADHDFDAALDAVFAEGLADLVPLLPDYWHDYGAKYFDKVGTVPGTAELSAQDKAVALRKNFQTDTSSGGKDTAAHVRGGVKPPSVAHSQEPKFTDLARAQKFSGNVEVYLWCEKDGSPTHLRIVRPVGLGLDEEAIFAVSHYKFKPAMKDGLPVKVDLYIDVNFQIF